MDLSQKMFLLLGHERNVIYSNLVNNPFNVYNTDQTVYNVHSTGTDHGVMFAASEAIQISAVLLDKYIQT